MRKTCPERTRRIAITGGKGGTGKSTVSILLANKLRSENKSVVLCDCDVECPNDYLLLGQKLGKPKKRVFAQFPKLDKEKCVKCALCVKNCRSTAIFQAPGKYPVFIHELCSGCGLCWHLCPHQAIKIEKKTIGEIFENNVDENFYLVAGRSVGVVDETGPIVSKTKDYALKLAKRIKADYLLTDTSVGMHCGVIRALIGADLAYAVTEPTPLGAHDLELILNLLRTLPPSPHRRRTAGKAFGDARQSGYGASAPRFQRTSGVPAKIVLNQADLGKKELIEAIAKKTKVEIKYKIPYSRQLVEAYSKGKLQKLNLL